VFCFNVIAIIIESKNILTKRYKVEQRATQVIGDDLVQACRATGISRFEGDKFPVVFWKNPENSRCKINDLFPCKHVYYCQKVANTYSFLPTA